MSIQPIQTRSLTTIKSLSYLPYSPDSNPLLFQTATTLSSADKLQLSSAASLPVKQTGNPIQQLLTKLKSILFPTHLTPQAPSDLVEVPGFQTGDHLKIQGPLWFHGNGQINALTANSFDVDLTVSSYHYLLNAKRIDDKKAHLIFKDVNSGQVTEQDATYTRTGNRTEFHMAPGGDVEGFIIDGKRSGYFENTIQQPSREITLKVTKA